MSDSVQPHRRKATRLPRPWDSPGKNTRVGCHFLLQCMKVKSEREVAQSCLTLSDPMDCSLPGSSIHGVFQARVLEWGAIAFSVYTSRLMLIPHCFDYYSSVEVLKLGNVSCSTLLFFEIVLAIQGPLRFQMNMKYYISMCWDLSLCSFILYSASILTAISMFTRS